MPRTRRLHYRENSRRRACFFALARRLFARARNSFAPARQHLPFYDNPTAEDAAGYAFVRVETDAECFAADARALFDGRWTRLDLSDVDSGVEPRATSESVAGSAAGTAAEFAAGTTSGSTAGFAADTASESVAGFAVDTASGSVAGAGTLWIAVRGGRLIIAEGGAEPDLSARVRVLLPGDAWSNADRPGVRIVYHPPVPRSEFLLFHVFVDVETPADGP